MAPKLNQKRAFACLGLVPTADAATIRSSYRELILEHHPDKSGTNESAARFIEIKEAYEFLCKHRVVLPTPKRPRSPRPYSRHQPRPKQSHQDTFSRGEERIYPQQTSSTARAPARGRPRDSTHAASGTQRRGENQQPATTGRYAGYDDPRSQPSDPQEPRPKPPQEAPHEPPPEPEPEPEPEPTRCCDPNFASPDSPLSIANSIWVQQQTERRRAVFLWILYPMAYPLYTGSKDDFAPLRCSCPFPFTPPHCIALQHFELRYRCNDRHHIGTERDWYAEHAFGEIERCASFCDGVLKDAEAQNKLMPDFVVGKEQREKFKVHKEIINAQVASVEKAMGETWAWELGLRMQKALEDFRRGWGDAVVTDVLGEVEDRLNLVLQRLKSVERRYKALKF